MIICYCGASTGSGKTHLMLEHGIRRANRYQKALVTNFPLNLDGLYQYALLNKYKHILHLINCGGIFYVDAESNIELITKLKRAVILADELGFLAFARDHTSTPRELLKDVALTRHDGSDLFFSCQYVAQVDVGFTRLCHWFFFCKSFNVDDKNGNPQMTIVSYHKFNKAKFEMWTASPKAQDNALKTRFAYAMETVDRIVSLNDKWIFNCYNSFGKLGGALEYSQGQYYRLKNIPDITDILNWNLWFNRKQYICSQSEFSEKEIYITFGTYPRKVKLSYAALLLRLFKKFPGALQEHIIILGNILEYGIKDVPSKFYNLYYRLAGYADKYVPNQGKTFYYHPSTFGKEPPKVYSTRYIKSEIEGLSSGLAERPRPHNNKLLDGDGWGRTDPLDSLPLRVVKKRFGNSEKSNKKKSS